MARAVGGGRVIDLLFHLPESYVDRRARATIKGAVPGQIATLAVEVVRIEPPGTGRQPTRVVVTDGTGFAELVYFRQFPAARLKPGARVVISGRFDERAQMVHPDHVAPEGAGGVPAVEPVWPLTAGLFAWHLRRPVAEAVGRVPVLAEWQDAALLRREKWGGFAETLAGLQVPGVPPSPALRPIAKQACSR